MTADRFDGSCKVITNAQNEHMADIEQDFRCEMRRKYIKGAAEHSGNLQDSSVASLIDNAIDEAVDQYVYLHTAREKVKAFNIFLCSGLTPRLLSAIEEEMAKAKNKHGPLTVDAFRANAVLVEEVGEVSKALLMLKRDGTPYEVIAELLQVIATAVFMIQNLDGEKLYV